MAKKDSVIFYQAQIKICREHFSAEQFGRLMEALFALDDGEEPEVDDDIALAFDFMSLQQKLDKEKYDKIVERNRENGKKGGRPRKNPNNPNGFSENPNDNENDKRMIREENDNENEQIHDSVSFGSFQNVELTEEEYFSLRSKYERVDKLIDNVSMWLRGAKNEVPDHYGLCIKFADNDDWPKRKVIEPVRPIEIVDPISEEEQEERVAEMRAKVIGAFPSG